MKFITLVCLTILLGVSSQNSYSEVQFKRMQKLEASDRATNDMFGFAVAISADVMAVGAPNDDDEGTNSGAVYLYQMQENSLDWVLLKKLVPNDGENQDMFGTSVDLDEDTLVVGAPGANIEGGTYIYERDRGGPDNWGQTIKISPDGSGFNRFGTSVAVSKNSLVVATFNRQAAYLYERNLGGNDSWNLSKTLVRPNGTAGETFGSIVSIYDDIVVIGEPGLVESFNGSVFVYNRNQGGNENWGHIKTLESDGNHPDGESRFGTAIDIDGDTIIVGAPQEFPTDITPTGYQIGTAYVFQEDQGGVGNWGKVVTLKPAGRVYDDDDPHTDNDLNFGVSVSIHGDVIAVGASRDDDVNFDSGSAYMFQRNRSGDNRWGQIRRPLASDGDRGDFYGGRVALSLNALLIGAVGVDAPGSSSSGAAYILPFNSNIENDGLCFVIKSGIDGKKSPICVN